MNDHPELYDLVRNPARDRLYNTAAAAIGWITFTLVMAAAPCIVWLWRWAL